MIYKKSISMMSNYIARELNLTNKEKDRIRFGLEIVISTLTSFLTTMFFAYLFDITGLVFLILTFSAVMKMVGGGIHLKTVWECAVFSALLYNLMGLIAKGLIPTISNHIFLSTSITSTFVLISLYLWSPAEVSNKPITEAKKSKLKKISLGLGFFFIVVVTILFFVFSDKFSILGIGIIAGLVFHALNINPLAFFITNTYYNFKNHLIKEG